MTNCDKRDILEIWAKEDWHSANVELITENGKLYISLENLLTENKDSSNSIPLADSLANQKRYVRISKTDSNGLGISIKGGRENRMVCLLNLVCYTFGTYLYTPCP